MNAKTSIVVLDAIIGRFGDMSSEHITVMKAAVGLKSVLKATEMLKEKNGGEPIDDINRRLRDASLKDLDQTFSDLVAISCQYLNISEQDLYREALSGEELEGI